MLDTVMTPVISACVHSLYCPVQCHSGESKQRAGSVKMAQVWMQGRDWHYHSCFPYAAAVVSKSAQCMLVLAACANNQTGVKCCSSTRVDGHPESPGQNACMWTKVLRELYVKLLHRGLPLKEKQ